MCVCMGEEKKERVQGIERLLYVVTCIGFLNACTRQSHRPSPHPSIGEPCLSVLLCLSCTSHQGSSPQQIIVYRSQVLCPDLCLTTTEAGPLLPCNGRTVEYFRKLTIYNLEMMYLSIPFNRNAKEHLIGRRAGQSLHETGMYVLHTVLYC